MENSGSLRERPPVYTGNEDEIEARIRELRSDPRWCELYEGASKKSLRQFIKYDRKHPELYRLLHRFALEARAHGWTDFPFVVICARTKWYIEIENKGEVVNLNSSYRSFYARKLIHEFPELEGFLRIRTLLR